MKARTHDLAAVTVLGVVTLMYPPETMTLATVLMALLANQLGGIAPDIDQPTAPFWRNLPVGGFFGRMITKMMSGHRFITHSVVGLILFGFAVKWLLALIHPIFPTVNVDLVWWAFMIGMVSHLVMDSFTKEGVPWLLPLPIKFGFPPIRAWRVTTGTLGEGIIFCLILLFGVWLCTSNYQAILDLVHHKVT
jgi:inner membrane protein